MGKQNKNGFGKLVNQLNGLILGLVGFVSVIVGFFKLAQGNAGLVALIFLALGVAIIWLACLYFFRFWKPESIDSKSNLYVTRQTKRQEKRQHQKEQLRKGNALADLGKLDEAIEAFDQALAINPDYHLALFNKGTALADLGKLDEAIEAFDQALAIKPNFYEALTSKGNVLADLGKLDEAIEAYDHALAMPNFYEALTNKGLRKAG